LTEQDIFGSREGYDEVRKYEGKSSTSFPKAYHPTKLSCPDFDSRESILGLVFFVFIPGLIQRVIGHLIYRKRDPLDFRNTFQAFKFSGTHHTVDGLFLT